MSNIDDAVSTIRNESLGEEVRSSIIYGINILDKQINSPGESIVTESSNPVQSGAVYNYYHQHLINSENILF